MPPNSVPLDDVLLTIDDLAVIHHCHPATIRRAVERGTLPPPMRIGNKLLWHRLKILEHIERQQQQLPAIKPKVFL